MRGYKGPNLFKAASISLSKKTIRYYRAHFLKSDRLCITTIGPKYPHISKTKRAASFGKGKHLIVLPST